MVMVYSCFGGKEYVSLLTVLVITACLFLEDPFILIMKGPSSKFGTLVCLHCLKGRFAYKMHFYKHG